MSFDYSSLFHQESEDCLTWKELYNFNGSLTDNFIHLLKQTVILPYDHYKLITAYAFIPSVLAKVVPYLFLFGRSGSGKSTVGKLISYLHGVTITSSSDTFAAIRNALEQRRKTTVMVQVHDKDGNICFLPKNVLANTFMVWDDVDPKVFTAKGDIYRLFKFGYDKSCDTIQIASGEVSGTNNVFRCFCPKVFSSVTPLHLHEDFVELRRRLLIIPTKVLEDISDTRKLELGIIGDLWEQQIINLDDYQWTGFSELFNQFWDLERAKRYLDTRKHLSKCLRGISSRERAISLDLLATGISADIWLNQNEAIEEVKNYWQWLNGEIADGETPFKVLLSQLVQLEEENAKNGNLEPTVLNHKIRLNLDIWFQQGQLLEKPNASMIQSAMHELGYRLAIGGKWIKT